MIEGVAGTGDDFMLGTNEKTALPNDILDNVKELLDSIREYYPILGAVSIEWVFDGNKIWLVQLNQIKNIGGGRIIVFGSPISYEKFYVKNGLEQLRQKIKEVKDKNIGIELVGDVGLSSHFGDVLRQANIPSFITK